MIKRRFEAPASRVAASTFKFVQVKAFGDLTIAAASLRRVPESELGRFGLLISPHLGELVDALAPRCRVETLPITDRSTPAFFDPQKRGVVERMRSAWSLRRSLAGTVAGSTLVMRHLTGRNRFITGVCSAVALPVADNIYAAYDAFFGSLVGDLVTPAASPSSRVRRLAICPYSRIAAKNIPADVVLAVWEVCARAGYVAELLLLEGELHEHPHVIPATVIPRRFAALGDALASYAGVISADSLPAHLAEYRGTPAFVVSPHPNEYWLPAHAYARNSWGLFRAREDLSRRLTTFLDNEVFGA